jgi:calcineurin-like phosphoesterase family protein
LERLNGKIYLIRGNHDKHIDDMEWRFEWIKDYFKLKIADDSTERGIQEIILSHYAFRVWDKSHYGSFHAYGHSHSSLPDLPESRSADVGVDAVAKWLSEGTLRPGNYRPISYEEFRGWMKAKTWKPIDHHRGDTDGPEQSNLPTDNH